MLQGINFFYNEIIYVFALRGSVNCHTGDVVQRISYRESHPGDAFKGALLYTPLGMF